MDSPYYFSNLPPNLFKFNLSENHPILVEKSLDSGLIVGFDSIMSIFVFRVVQTDYVRES